MMSWGITSWSKTERRRIWDKSKAGWQTYPLSVSPVGEPASIKLHCMHLGPRFLCMKQATTGRLYVSRGCENIPVITMENSPSCHQMGGNILSLSAGKCVLLWDNPAMFIFWNSRRSASTPHRPGSCSCCSNLTTVSACEWGVTSAYVCAYVCMCLSGCDREREREVKVSFSLVCAWTLRINQGSEDDEYNYNNMTNLMLKPQNWQDCCCLFSLKQLKNQSLYMFHTLSLKATYCSHKEVIRSRLSIFLQCILVLM